MRDYKYAQKNNWRRTIWNEVLSRTTGRELIDPILYLAGPGDLDRSIAIEKGVPNQNLIAVDLSRQNIDRIKSGGVPALCSEVCEVLEAWPIQRKVSALLLDFCCGFEQKLINRLFPVLLRPPFNGAAVMFNFLRGRDPSTNALRTAFYSNINTVVACREAFLHHPMSRHISELSRTEKNRAFHVILLYCLTCYYEVMVARGYTGEQIITNERTTGESCAAIYGERRPVFMSYHSGATVFDSVVFKPLSLDDYHRNGVIVKPESLEKIFTVATQLRHRIGAMLAVRSRRSA